VTASKTNRQRKGLPCPGVGSLTLRQVGASDRVSPIGALSCSEIAPEFAGHSALSQSRPVQIPACRGRCSNQSVSTDARKIARRRSGTKSRWLESRNRPAAQRPMVMLSSSLRLSPISPPREAEDVLGSTVRRLAAPEPARDSTRPQLRQPAIREPLHHNRLNPGSAPLAHPNHLPEVARLATRQ